MQQSSALPTQKVIAGGLAGALSIILVYLINLLAGVEIPGEVASAITTVLFFGVAYLVPPSDRDVIESSG